MIVALDELKIYCTGRLPKRNRYQQGLHCLVGVGYFFLRPEYRSDALRLSIL